jgi:hypothetical protein
MFIFSVFQGNNILNLTPSFRKEKRDSGVKSGLSVKVDCAAGLE